MKDTIKKKARKTLMSARSPWSSLNKTVNKLNRIAKKRKASASYRDKAERMQLKNAIGKLKKELKEAQKSNLDLLYTIDVLTKKLEDAAGQLASVSDALNTLRSTVETKASCDD